MPRPLVDLLTHADCLLARALRPCWRARRFGTPWAPTSSSSARAARSASSRLPRSSRWWAAGCCCTDAQSASRHRRALISPHDLLTSSPRSPHELPTSSPRSPHELPTISSRSPHDLLTISSRSPTSSPRAPTSSPRSPPISLGARLSAQFYSVELPHACLLHGISIVVLLFSCYVQSSLARRDFVVSLLLNCMKNQRIEQIQKEKERLEYASTR